MPTFPSALLQGGVLPAGAQVQRMPSQAERDEIARVQGMQVRTNAANIAGQLLHGTAPKVTEFTALAKVVELYILGD